MIGLQFLNDFQQDDSLCTARRGGPPTCLQTLLEVFKLGYIDSTELLLVYVCSSCLTGATLYDVHTQLPYKHMSKQYIPPSADSHLQTAYNRTAHRRRKFEGYLSEGLQLNRPNLNQPKIKFYNFLRLIWNHQLPLFPTWRIDSPGTRSHPQGGVQIYPKGKFTKDTKS